MEKLLRQTNVLLDLLGHSEEPMGVFYTNTKPVEGYGPKEGEIFTREREEAGEIDWRNMAETFSCMISNIWLARKKKKPAWLSHEHCGCMGGGFYSGMYTPYLEFNIFYVSTGVPGTPVDGEHYLPSAQSMRAFMDEVNPRPAPGKYGVIKHLSLFENDERPEIVVFFARPEVLTGLHSLVSYTTGDYNAIQSPFGAACTNIITWPLTYMAKKEEKAVLGGFDPSARKFFKTDELTFAVPLPLYRKMLDAMESSALARDIWKNGPLKKVRRSAQTWDENLREA